MQIQSIAELLEPVRTAGAMALQEQRRSGFVQKTYKQDGSPVTEVDQRVEDYLYAEISRRWPAANILTEETVHPYDPARAYTFALDPIDGTDVYSQGMAGWCVSVGLLDGGLRPVAGIVYAPRLDLLFFADVGQEATCDGYAIVLPHRWDAHSERSRLMVSSRIYRELDLANYTGKGWGVGSAALHICFPLIYPDVIGSLQHRGTYIWDLAGAHAITLSHGLDVEYWSGAGVDYAALVDGGQVPDTILSGSPLVLQSLRSVLDRR
jgi:fructose-1,6-bisphosphatase/inositol monophosphatase family enzyme